MKTSALTFIAALFGIISLTFIPRDDVPLDKLITNLQRWTDSIPQEKVYLHMDKPYYALGDTIWFKGYLTIGARHQLSKLSGAVYVELINERDSLLQQLKLPVTSGMVMGNFILKDDYPQGSYRLRAYTQWMRNAGEEYFYDHTFLVGDVAGGEIIAKANFSYQDNKGKQILAALLNYSNDQGKPLAGRSLRYEIWANHKTLWQQNTHTDEQGNLRILIPDDIKQNPAGAYLHTILQGSDKYPVTRDFPIKVMLSQSDVQFFPEGGGLINGVQSRVAFKALDIYGLSTNIKGIITDESHKEVARLQTLHAGMGSFLMTPVSGKSYTANITFEDGSTRNITLPKAADEGYALSVYQPNKDSVLVRVHPSAGLQQSTVNLLVHNNGEMIFAAPVKMEKPLASLWLKKSLFPTGIAQFTLFNNSGEPLNERIAFIRSNDQMSLNITTAKIDYKSKEKVNIGLKATDSKGQPTFGNFSVSVIDESKVPYQEAKESTIFSNLLLTSDLKGHIEEPNYYFINNNDTTNRALDNLMLTQGYRRFAWKELNSTVNSKPLFPAENIGTVISGSVVTLNDKPKPVAGANVSLVALRANAVKSAISGPDGRFKFEPFFLTDSIKLSIQARTAKGSDKIKLTLDTIPGIKINANPNPQDASLNLYSSLKQFLESGKKQDDVYEKMGLLDKVHRLKEVKIRAQKPDPLKNYAYQWGPMLPDGKADQVIYPKNLENAGLLGMGLAQYMHKVVFYAFMGTPMYPYLPAFPKPVPMTIILNGRKLKPDEAAGIFDGSQLDPADVVRVDILTTNFYIYTKPESKRRIRYMPNMLNFATKGYNKVREFYSPKYDTPNANLTLPDLRSTVYWSPYLKTDASGKTTFSFFNADGPGRYKVTVEGINADGQLGRQVYHYTVNEMQASTVNH